MEFASIPPRLKPGVIHILPRRGWFVQRTILLKSSLNLSKFAADRSSLSPNSSNIPPDKPETSPNGSDKSPKRSETSPNDSDKPPSKFELSPKVFEMSPNESDNSPDISKMSPNQSDKNPNQSEMSPKESNISLNDSEMFKVDSYIPPCEYENSSKVFSQSRESVWHLSQKVLVQLNYIIEHSPQVMIPLFLFRSFRSMELIAF